VGNSLVMIENKIDPGYQDAAQILDEIDGGRMTASQEGLEFVFVLIAPGPLSSAMSQALRSGGGRFIAWSRAVELLQGVPCTAASAVLPHSLEEWDRPLGAAGCRTPDTDGPLRR
jgi:hypothetical protein